MSKSNNVTLDENISFFLFFSNKLGNDEWRRPAVKYELLLIFETLAEKTKTRFFSSCY